MTPAPASAPDSPPPIPEVATPAAIEPALTVPSMPEAHERAAEQIPVTGAQGDSGVLPSEVPVQSSPPPLPVVQETVHEELPAPEPVPVPRPVLEFDWQTDLTQIETDREKLRAAEERAAHEEPLAPPPKRERRPPPPVSAEPLIQVETLKNASAAAASAPREESLPKAVTG